MNRIFPLVFSLLLLFYICIQSCSPARSLPTEQEVSLAKKEWKDVDLISLRTGCSLYSGKCGRCHELYKPGEYSEDDWADILPHMARKAKITDAEQELIRRFILTRRTYTLSKK
jgi:hypothetical protein